VLEEGGVGIDSKGEVRGGKRKYCSSHSVGWGRGANKGGAIRGLRGGWFKRGTSP